MKKPSILVLCCLGITLSSVVKCNAGIRGPGKYCGIPIFDRWDGCTLYDGVFVMYFAEDVKESLRSYAGKPIQIDAKKVVQILNPGDGVINELEYLGPAPDGLRTSDMKGVVLVSSVKLQEDGKPVARMTIENNSKGQRRFFSTDLSFTVLMKCAPLKGSYPASNGRSFALITRQSFYIGGSSRSRWQSEGVQGGRPYTWTIGEENALPSEFMVQSGEMKQIDIKLDLPDGQYDFLFGYGGGAHGGRCLASNLSAFNVKNGKAKIVKIENR